MVWAYVEGGAECEVTLRSNLAAFDRYRLRSRVLTGSEVTDTAVTIAGAELELPVALAPTGLTGLSHWTGELGAAQAAERAGTRATVSTGATYSVEEVARGTSEDHWFQLYPWCTGDGSYDLIASLMDRARNSGYRVLMVTVDVPAIGNRESERRSGMGAPPVLTPTRILGAAVRPRWWYHFFKDQRISMKILSEQRGMSAAVASAQMQLRYTRPDLRWEDLEWMRDRWNGAFFVKGVLDADDAERAINLGADGVVVSNHGGRQLDNAIATLDALPAIAARVGQRGQILLDGGVRRGTDVVKALCLGADAVLVGRPFIYGLATSGPAGVQGVLGILRDELRRALTLMGLARVADLDRSWLLPADSPV